MLQQTSVAVVIDYFNAWIDRFPTVLALANSTEEEVLCVWQGLGYYQRCINLLHASRQILDQGMPETYEQWLDTIGVGRYTAAAISSIAYREPQASVDGNVKRVFARYTENSSTGSALESQARQWAQNTIDRLNPGDWNQAMMELGATICTPNTPKCGLCPISTGCCADRNGTVSQFPMVQPRRAPVQLTLRFKIFVRNTGNEYELAMVQMKSSRWWKNMYGLPNCDGNSLALNSLQVGPIKHTVTNHQLTLFGHLMCPDDMTVEELNSAVWVPIRNRSVVPIPSAFEKIIKEFEFKLVSCQPQLKL